MPIERAERVQTLDKSQQQQNNAQQHDAARDETVAQIAEQHDRRLSARYMRAGRYDQRPDDHLLDVRKYLPGDRLDMFGIECQPFGSDLRHGVFLGFSLQLSMGASLQRVRDLEARRPLPGLR